MEHYPPHSLEPAAAEPPAQDRSRAGPILKLQAIRKTYSGVVAVDGVDFDVLPGETHVLLGENGAGKSTLIKLIAGAIDKDSGTALFDGRHLDGRLPQQRREDGLAVIYQELSLVPGLSVASNIFLGRPMKQASLLAALGIEPRGRMLAACRALFASLGIEIDPREKVENLSIAQRQLVEVARAMAFESKLVLMDEPTTALGPKEKEALFRIIATLKSRKVAIVFISHILEDCLAIGDRITVLRDGRLIKVFGKGEADEAALIAAMTGRARALPAASGPRAPRAPAKVIEVRNLSVPKRFSNVSFDLHEGEILGFAGLVGAGRTEVMEALFGAGPRPSAGEIVLFGTPVSRMTPGRALAAGISLLTEDRKKLGIIPRLAISQNMAVSGLNLRGSSLRNRLRSLGVLVSGAKLRAFAREMIARHGVRASSGEQLISHLSGGNQQKVLLARAMAAQSRIIILDEPTKGIDVGAREEIYATLRALAANGASLIVVSSEIPEVLALADRIVVMAHGRIAGVVERADATPEGILNLAFDREPARSPS
ncbi:sugar ABC transporter ATP-binding protein [Ancylobacter sp. G4_0304]|uniref:sugar ABC transporter ATP-binding protein n=1 Tax=Ancylobacter sp. G4_0304 TaxID=3114289 RepID=UPI0039C65099